MVAATVATAPGFAYPGTNTQPLVQDAFTLFETPGGGPVLIETVHLACDYGNGAPAGDQWILRLLDSAGHTLFAQKTPAFSANDVPGSVEVTWSRGASEVGSLPIVDFDKQGYADYTGIFTVPLPDLILDPLSVIQLQLIQNIIGGGSSAFSVVQPVITYDGSGVAGSGTALDTFPLLLPAADS